MKLIILKTLFSFLALFSTTLNAVEVELQLTSNSAPRMVTLPFPYKHLSPEERKATPLIFERYYIVLEDNSVQKNVIVGPLQPCLFVGLRNQKNGKTIIFHKHYSNSIQSMIDITKKELGLIEPQDLVGRIFTCKMEGYATPVLGPDGKNYTLQALHQGKTQLDEIKYVKDKIIEAFSVQDRSQITAQIYNSKYKNYELGNYEYAELCVFTDNKLNMHSICLMHENVLQNAEHLPLLVRRNLYSKLLQKENQAALNAFIECEYNRQMPREEIVKQLNSYGAVSFKKSDKS